MRRRRASRPLALLAASLLCAATAAPALAQAARSGREGRRAAETERARYLADRDALMVTLGTWATASIASGLALWLGAPARDDERRATGIQHVAWGGINAGLALVALVRSPLQRHHAHTAAHWREERDDLAFTFLWNAGLDVLYVTAGILLRALGRAAWVRGTGTGVLVQGGWLLVFDSASALFVRERARAR